MSNEIPIQEVKKTSESDCGCGAHNEDLPTLDCRPIVPRLRHAAIFGALDSLRPGEAMGLIAPHDPIPLLNQIREAKGDSVEISYLSEDPWTLKFAVR